MKWSQLKKRVESMFAASVRGRVEIWSTAYRGGIGSEGNVWLTLDKEPIFNVSICNDDFVFYAKRDLDKDEPRPEIDQYLVRWDFHKLLFQYLNSSIQQVLKAKNYVARALGMLDSRVGKRRLMGLDVSG